MPSKTNWSDLNEAEKLELYKRLYVDETHTAQELADETGIYLISLKRELQRYKKAIEGTEGMDEESNVELKVADANNMTISSNKNTRVTNLRQLLEICEVDLNEWKVDKHIVNTWEGYRATDDGFDITTLYQVKAWLVRVNPIAISPVVTPVSFKEFSFAYNRREKDDREVKKTLVIPDLHVYFKRDLRTGRLEPLHDRVAMSIILQLVESEEFDHIVFLGDNFDFPDFSTKFVTEPEYIFCTQAAIEELAWFLAQIRLAQPNAKIDILEGNHDKRLRDSLLKHVPSAYRLQVAGNFDVDYSVWEIPNLLRLDELNIGWAGDYPNGEVWVSNDIVCIHGAGLSARKIVDASDVTTIFGHIHRYEADTRAIYRGGRTRTIYAYSPGFLGRMNGIIPGVKNNQRWSQGFGIIYHASNTDPNIVHVSINNGVAIVEGRLFYGQDYVKELRNDTDNRINY